MTPTEHLKCLRIQFCSKDYLESITLEQLASIENRTLKDLLGAINGVGKKVGVPVIVTYHVYLHDSNDKNIKKSDTSPTRSSC